MQEFGGVKVMKALTSESEVARLKKGDVVQVTKIEVMKTKVKGRVEGGWITLVDTLYNHRFARLKTIDKLSHVAR